MKKDIIIEKLLRENQQEIDRLTTKKDGSLKERLSKSVSKRIEAIRKYSNYLTKKIAYQI